MSATPTESRQRRVDSVTLVAAALSVVFALAIILQLLPTTEQTATSTSSSQLDAGAVRSPGAGESADATALLPLFIGGGGLAIVFIAVVLVASDRRPVEP